MPNWTENTLTITGDKKQIKQFKNQAKTKEDILLFNNFVPMPKELEGLSSPPTIVSQKDYEKKIEKVKMNSKKNEIELGLPITHKISKDLIKKFGTNNWYDWRVKNWGTKWDIGHNAELIEEDEDYLYYSFESAWSPPIDWLEKVSTQFPKLHFQLKYEEPSMSFMGVAKAENGQLNDQYIEY